MYRALYAILFLVPLLAACGRGEIVQPTTPTVYVAPRSATATAEAQQAAAATAAAPEAGESTTAEVIGDVANGQTLFTTFQAEANFACNTCHLADSESQLVGPGLLHISERAATRVDGQTAVAYIHNSIVNPHDYVVEGYPDNLMPGVYADIFSEEQINDLVAYLMTL
ncbi:MAG: hypothetical protein CL610_02970 [Anaerolineaceae bacterium]|nr:hypothetical protein [Anaerolineaceae bacterium]